MKDGFIPKHGGYEKLLSYQKAEIVYDATVWFCDRFVDTCLRHGFGRRERSRTHDQMVQAARSGKQNIIEGSMASATSKESEIKLTNVARASLEELSGGGIHSVHAQARGDFSGRSPSATVPTNHAPGRSSGASGCTRIQSWW